MKHTPALLWIQAWKSMEITQNVMFLLAFTGNEACMNVTFVTSTEKHENHHNVAFLLAFTSNEACMNVTFATTKVKQENYHRHYFFASFH